MATVEGLVNKIKLPRGMVLGLILPLGLMGLMHQEEDYDYLGNETPLYTALIDEVDWPKFFDAISPELTTTNLVLQFPGDFISEDIVEFLIEEGLNGIILRLDQAAVSKAGYFFWRHHYGYCQEFSQIEATLASLIEKASNV